MEVFNDYSEVLNLVCQFIGFVYDLVFSFIQGEDQKKLFLKCFLDWTLNLMYNWVKRKIADYKKKRAENAKIKEDKDCKH